ncbi:hypothetical protein SAMN04488118_104283 [Epibacterium ulvae]|uniref:Uncharacterized protein n=3 Tax=Alphaproteobacteria TaxID=28211 RepID=A0A1G5QIQ1_9RHOB|nr:hypothetical protein [Epibacterium ulvae]AGI04151.1 hypothetical protein [alpha proteobacterium U95]SCZ61735.1 hypothetical protein SAMN04488118_104283 [Epibacterium ulvae]
MLFLHNGVASMTENRTTLFIVNLDLSRSEFEHVATAFVSQERQDFPYHLFPEINQGDLDIPSCSGGAIEVVFAFKRRPYARPDLTVELLKAISKFHMHLEKVQAKSLISNVTMIDYGDLYAPPLSDLSEIGQLFEVSSSELNHEVARKIFAADVSSSGEEDDEFSVNITFEDTETEEFRGHIARYILQSLSGLTGNSQSIPLPNVQSGGQNPDTSSSVKSLLQNLQVNLDD